MQLTALVAGLFLSADLPFDRIPLSAGQGPGSVAIADVNHDGHPDILIANTTGRTLTVLLGDGRGHFHPAPGEPCPTGQSPNDLALGDFNGDGNLDVAIANTETPLITILLGDGKGGFKPSPHSPFTVDSHPHVHGLAAADFTGDGKLDVVTDDWGRNQIRLLAGDGAGNLIGSGKAFPTGKRPYQRVRSGDFNRDGKPDVVTTNLDENTVSILLNDGKGGFQSATFPAGVFPWAVAVDDLDKDGNLDLAVIPYDRDIRDPRQLGLTVLLGDGKGAFRTMPGSPFSLAGCRGPDRVAIGDINGDGLRDIVVSCAQNNKLIVFLGSSGGYQSSAIDVPTGWAGLAVGDLNGDGKEDIVVTNNSGSGPGVTILLSR
ncbi:MAG TPA: VCBS repeat-containing protein [Bryobacteraceae bacterium]|nr:VCBS repeat-containing protein [Bryobacteraceae bacterium]